MSPSIGKHFAGAHQNDIADRDLVDRHVFEALCAASVRDARRAIDQRPEVAFGAGNREVLENVAAGIHDRDYDGGKVSTEQQRGGHRHERDGIDTDAAVEKSRSIEMASPTATGTVPSAHAQFAAPARPATQRAMPATSATTATASRPRRKVRSMLLPCRRPRDRQLKGCGFKSQTDQRGSVPASDGFMGSFRRGRYASPENSPAARILRRP